MNSVTDIYTSMFSTSSILLSLVFCLIVIIGMMKIYSKANIPVIGAIIPFYNTYLLTKITLGNGWLFLLLFIPFVDFFVYLIILYQLSRKFGKGILFTIGLIFLSPIFILILGFGKSTYNPAA